MQYTNLNFNEEKKTNKSLTNKTHCVLLLS